MFSPSHSHELAQKRIGRYLKAICLIWLILNPPSNLKIHCYPDHDFVGRYRHDNINDPACVINRTGYISTVADCPLLWQSKHLSKTALSTMESEVITLAHSCRELLSKIGMVISLGDAVGLPMSLTTMNVSIHEEILEHWLWQRFYHLSTNPKVIIML